MTTDPAVAVHAFATLRFAGDQLDPHEMTEVLGAQPTLAYRKGEPYPVGPRRQRIGKTGLWMFSTDGRVPDHDLAAHLDAVALLIAGDPAHPAASGRLIASRRRDDKLRAIRDMVERRSLRPLVTIFWHGPRAASVPAIGPAFRDLVARIHGEVEEDFAVDGEGGGEPREPKLASA